VRWPAVPVLAVSPDALTSVPGAGATATAPVRMAIGVTLSRGSVKDAGPAMAGSGAPRRTGAVIARISRCMCAGTPDSSM
jgi:hypothetical protein